MNRMQFSLNAISIALLNERVIQLNLEKEDMEKAIDFYLLLETYTQMQLKLLKI